MNGRAIFAVLAGLVLAPVAKAEDPPLAVETKIPLGNVAGRIDHFAFDAERQLLFVAEIGNDSVGIVDLKAGKVLHRLTGLREPQGLAWHAATRTLYVANGGDGSVRLYQGADFTPAGALELGDDADNIRLDPWRDRIVVGYGRGALGIIDPKSRKKIGDVPLKAHPEAFQFDDSGARIFVNVPNAHEIAAVDVAAARATASLETATDRANYPMAIDATLHRVLVVYRLPPRMAVFGANDGKLQDKIDVCRDADDLFVDSKRHRIYVSCGVGVIDVLGESDGTYRRLARLPTVGGARTSLYVTSTDRLYLGVRATGSEPAAIWVLRPTP
jgi:hypothetical protein